MTRPKVLNMHRTMMREEWLREQRTVARYRERIDALLPADRRAHAWDVIERKSDRGFNDPWLFYGRIYRALLRGQRPGRVRIRRATRAMQWAIDLLGWRDKERAIFDSVDRAYIPDTAGDVAAYFERVATRLLRLAYQRHPGARTIPFAVRVGAAKRPRQGAAQCPVGIRPACK